MGGTIGEPSGGIEVPSEHGFWVMLMVALLAGAGATHYAFPALGMALGLGMATAYLAGRWHKRVRKRPAYQLAASAALALLTIPIQLAALAPALDVLLGALAWVSAYLGFSFSVRAIFDRARVRGPLAARNTILALALPCATAILSGKLGDPRDLWVCLVGLFGSLIFAIWRPKPRKLRHSGMLMTALLMLALGLWLWL